MNTLGKVLRAALFAGTLIMGLSSCGTSGSSGGSSVVASTAYTAKSWADVSVISGNQQVTIGWTDTAIPSSASATAAASTSSVSYNIYFSTSPGVSKTGANVTKFANVSSGFVHSGLQNNTSYYYVITAVSSGVEGIESAEASATPQAALPAAPTGLSIQAGAGSVSLFMANPDANLIYNVYWSTTPGLSKDLRTKLPNAKFAGATTPFVHSSLLSDGITSYYYVVTAQNAAGESAVSGELSARLASSSTGTPQGVKAAVGNQQMTVTWSPPSPPVGTSPTYLYTISWWAGGETAPHTIAVPGSLAANLDGSFSVPVQSLANGTVYNCTVSAAASAGSNPAQVANAQVSVVPQAKSPAVPANLSASAGNQQIALSWLRDSSSDAVTYNVYWTNTPGQSLDKWSKISSIQTNTFSHTGLISGQTYYYKVSAVVVSTAGESSPSAQVSLTP
jgi:fibronectin type 3 domain-containing protein